jgi:hypothetical protein
MMEGRQFLGACSGDRTRHEDVPYLPSGMEQHPQRAKIFNDKMLRGDVRGDTCWQGDALCWT